MPPSEEGGLRLSWVDDGRALRIEGAREGASLAVFPAESLDSGIAGLEPIAGRLDEADYGVTFIPRFPLARGLEYAVRSNGPGEIDTKCDARIALPARGARPIARVTECYPTGTWLPLNHLRFYLHFSHSMSASLAAQSIRLVDAISGKPLTDAILEMEPELWDGERKRLTVLLDPGRIKRGLVPHEETGYPLKAGCDVFLDVDQGFRDAEGVPLAEPFARRYEVREAIRSRLDSGDWQIGSVAAGTTSPLEVQFDRQLDHALTGRCLWVEDPSGQRIEGVATVGPGESTWSFVPATPWANDSSKLAVDRILEDVAGNSLLRPFDRDLEGDDQKGASGPRIERIPLASW